MMLAMMRAQQPLILSPTCSSSCSSLSSSSSSSSSSLIVFSHFYRSSSSNNRFRVRAVRDKTKQDPPPSPPPPSAEEVTKKYGLEAGLWKIFRSKEGGKGEKTKTDEAKELLGKYGGAYLATSITLSLISFTLCYALVNSGVDVSALLQKVGITTNETGEKVGTFALAYAAHKAASPIRFPPTVALTPIVASWISKLLQDKPDSSS